jgi:hypothetical protein
VFPTIFPTFIVIAPIACNKRRTPSVITEGHSLPASIRGGVKHHTYRQVTPSPPLCTHPQLRGFWSSACQLTCGKLSFPHPESSEDIVTRTRARPLVALGKMPRVIC